MILVSVIVPIYNQERFLLDCLASIERQTLLENGSIYAVIGLPSNMFYNTSIPTCIVVLKKHREGRAVRSSSLRSSFSNGAMI